MKNKGIFAAFLVILSSFVFGQSTITGRVLDGKSGEPLPFVTIKATNQPEGAVTDFDGFYTISTDLSIDSLEASYLGFEKNKVPVIKGLSKQTINFTLMERENVLKEFVVRPGGVNPAEVIMKRVRKNKKTFNPEKLEQYEYESYTKVQLALDNVTEKLQKRNIYKAIAPMFDTISALTDTNSSKVLPVFVSETISDYFYRKTPRRTKEVIKAAKVLGVGVGDESYIAQLLGSTFTQYNFYENSLYILDKDFISPLSLMAGSYYFFTYIDSLEVDGTICYQIQVNPKNPKDLVFSGMLWISSKDYAVRRLSLEITKEANLNFIEKLKIQQEFSEIEPETWLPTKNRILIDIAEVTKNTAGIVGLYYNSASNVKLHQNHELPFYEEKVSVQEDAYKKDLAFWDTSRHEKISATDEKIYSMVDSLKNQPVIKSFVDAVEILVEGYIGKGKIEFGPYHYLVGFNNWQGFRTRIGFRTSPLFHKDFQIAGFVGYGFRDQKLRYGGDVSHVFNRKKWAKGGISVKDDIELLGLTDQGNTSALFDAFATLGTDQISRGVSQKIWFEKELIKGYTQNINFQRKFYDFQQIGKFNFKYLNADDSMLHNNFTTTSINLSGRISHKEQFVFRRNNRYSFGNLKAPVFTLNYSHGFKNAIGGEFEYDKVGLEIWQYNSLGNLGTFEYNVKINKAFGSLPYPILFVMQGNQSLFSNSSRYNMMNFFEFVADQYVHVDYEHQFNGLLLNRVPLLKKLKWREFVNVKAVYGTLGANNLALIPGGDGNISVPTTFVNGKPYWELGYGLENIFRFVRVDFIHRMSYLNQPNPIRPVRPFGVKLNAVLRF